MENILLHVGIFSLLEYRRNGEGGGKKKGKEGRKEKQEIEYNLITRGVNNRDKNCRETASRSSRDPFLFSFFFFPPPFDFYPILSAFPFARPLMGKWRERSNKSRTRRGKLENLMAYRERWNGWYEHPGNPVTRNIPSRLSLSVSEKKKKEIITRNWKKKKKE